MLGRGFLGSVFGGFALSAVLAAACFGGACQDGSRHYREGRLAESVEAFEQYARANPEAATAPFVIYGIGIIHEHEGRLAEAIEVYRRVIQSWPSSHAAREAARKVVLLCQRSGDWAAAADESVHRLCLLERYHPEYFDFRHALAIIDEMLEAGRQHALKISRDVWLDYEVSSDLYPRTDEVLRFAVGPDPEQSTGNLLRNPGFELDGRYIPQESPVGWDFQEARGQFANDHDGVVDADFLSGHGTPRTGNLCVGKHTNWGLAHGWYVQTVRAVPRQPYDCAVFALTGPATGPQGRVRLGVDPLGGSDPRADGVHWTDYMATDGKYQRIALDGEQAVTAGSNRMTLFLEMRQDVRAAHNVMLFDDASIVRSGAPAPPLQKAIDPPPPPTPTPLKCSTTEGDTRMGYDPALLPGGLLLLNEPSMNKIQKHPEKLEEWENETLPDICRKFRGCGMVAARVGLCWYNIEHEKEEFDWRISDEMVLQLEEHGIVHVACIATSPPWALDPGAVAALKRQGIAENLIGVTQIRQECWDDYEEYMERLVLRYRDSIDHWEIWNEPDGMAGHKLIRNVTGEVTSVEFGGDPVWMTELLKRSARTIRPLDPCAIICVGGFEDKHPPRAELLEGVYARGGNRYFDAVGIHTYGTPIHREWFCFLRQVMLDHGEGYKPFWVTEYGMRAQKDVKQAYKVRRSVRALREIPYVTIATGHIANMLWNGTGGPGYEAHQEMAAEKGPRTAFHQDFEGGAVGLLRHWEWDSKAEPKNKCWLEEGLEDVFPEQGNYYLTGRSNGLSITHILDTYVRPVSQKPVLSFLVLADPEPARGAIQLEVTVEPSDVCKQPRTLILYEEGLPVREWVRVNVALQESFPEFRDDIVMAVLVTGRMQRQPEEWEFAIDDIRIE